MDAYLRDFELYVPRDCTSSISGAGNRSALAYMKRMLDADTRPAAKLDMARLARRRAGGRH